MKTRTAKKIRNNYLDKNQYSQLQLINAFKKVKIHFIKIEKSLKDDFPIKRTIIMPGTILQEYELPE